MSIKSYGEIYLGNGSEDVDGSQRFAIDPDTGYMEVQKRVDGLWQPGDFETGPNSQWIGRNLGLSAAGHYLMTEEVGGDNHLLPHLPFDGQTATSDCKIPYPYYFTSRQITEADFSNDWVGTSLSWGEASTIGGLLAKGYWKTGTTAATQPIRIQAWKGTDDTGTLIFDQYYPASQFPSSTEVSTIQSGYTPIESGENYYTRISSTANFSLLTNALATKPWNAVDLTLVREDNMLQTKPWVSGDTWNSGDVFIDSRKLYVCNTTGVQSGTFASNSSLWDGLTYNSTPTFDYLTVDGRISTTNDLHNIEIGNNTLLNNTIGGLNVAIGTDVLKANTEGFSNIGIGPWTLSKNTTGDDNIGFGVNVLRDNTTGIRNIGIGQGTLTLNITGNRNIGIGVQSLASNTSGNFNVAIGETALLANTIGTQNIGIGATSLMSETEGHNNVAIGKAAMNSLTTAHANVAIGTSALQFNQTSFYNIAVGGESLLNTTGANNTAIGFAAGRTNTIGANSVFVGYEAGRNETASNRLYISNSSTASPLIYGEFDSALLRVNGDLDITGTFTGTLAPGVASTYYEGDGNFTGLRTANATAGGGIKFISTNFTESNFTNFGRMQVGPSVVWLQTGSGDGAGGVTATVGITIDQDDLPAILITDDFENAGMAYAADYSANFTARSIVDKAYIDAAVATENLWDRSGTTLSPTNSGDKISTTGDITTTGNVGIGVTDPDEALEVNGSIHKNGAIYNLKKVFTYNPSTTSTLYTQYLGTFSVDKGPTDIVIQDLGNGHFASSFFRVTRHYDRTPIVQIQNDGSNSADYKIYYRIISQTSYELFFEDNSGTNSNITYTTQMNTDSYTDSISASNDTDILEANVGMVTKEDGDVGIGTTTPTQKLDVRGNIALSGTVDGVDISANNASVTLNTTHRTSDGKDHADVVINNAKITNATHTGDVTGATVLTIGVDKVNDTHINFGTGATQVSTLDIPELTNLYYTEARVTANTNVSANTTHRGIVTGNPHAVTLTDVGGTTDHTALSNIGTNTHTQIDTHIANTTNPHSVDKSDVGLGNVANVDTTNASNISSGTLSSSVLPPIALTSVQLAANQVSQLALTTEEGDVVVRTDEEKSYMRNAGITGTMTDFTELQNSTDLVLSVNGETGTVILTTGDISEDANFNYVSDAELVVLGNTSGTNTGDDTNSYLRADIASIKTSGALTLNDNVALQLGTLGAEGRIISSGSGTYLDIFNGDFKIRDTSADRFTFSIATGNLSATGNITANNLSGTNTGDQDISGIGTNTTAIALNTTHRTSNGSDHSFLDQDVKVSSSPTFDSLTIQSANPESKITTTGDGNNSRITRTDVLGKVTRHNTVKVLDLIDPYSLQLDGVDDYILGGDISGNFTDEATVCFWVKIDSNTPTSTNAGIATLNTTSEDSLYPWTDGKLYISFFNAVRGIDAFIDTGFDKTVWHHLALTTKPGSGNYKLYRNGSLLTSGTGPATIDLGTTFKIGAHPNTFLKGNMDDVVIYNRELSSSEIATIANGDAPSATNLLVHWKLNEGTGTTATDSSGNSNNGTFVSSPTYTTSVPSQNPSAEMTAVDEEVEVWRSEDGVGDFEHGIHSFGASEGTTYVRGNEVIITLTNTETEAARFTPTSFNVLTDLDVTGTIISPTISSPTIQGLISITNTGDSIFIGEDAGIVDGLIAGRNVGVGKNSLKANTSGSDNVGVGYHSLISNITGTDNISLGAYTLVANTSGNGNIALGTNALVSLTVSDNNICMGYESGWNITNSSSNVGIGAGTLQSITTGAGENVAIGHEAGYTTTGVGNVFIGYTAGFYATGSDKLYIDNSTTSDPLIYGEFNNNLLKINGSLNVSTTTGTFRPPIMTTTQRDALTPVAGDVIYNSTTNKHQGYNGTIWNDFY